MGWNPRPTFQFSQTTDLHDSGLISYLLSLNKSISWPCKGNFLSSELFVFLTFLLILLAFSAFVLTGIDIDEERVPRNGHLALRLDSFSIIDFRVKENQLVANWTSRFIFINRRNDIEIPIEPFELLVFYKRTNLVSCASLADPLVLKTNYQAVIEVEFSPKGCKRELSIKDEVLQEMEKDIKKGRISLNLNLDLQARYKGNIWDYDLEFEPGCALNLEFNSTKLLAERFSGNLAKNCRIPLPA